MHKARSFSTLLCLEVYHSCERERESCFVPSQGLFYQSDLTRRARWVLFIFYFLNRTKWRWGVWDRTQFYWGSWTLTVLHVRPHFRVKISVSHLVHCLCLSMLRLLDCSRNLHCIFITLYLIKDLCFLPLTTTFHRITLI